MATETEVLYGTRLLRMIPYGEGQIESQFTFYQRGPEIPLAEVSEISGRINPGWSPNKSWIATKEEVLKYGELPLLPNPNVKPSDKGDSKFRGW